MTDDENFNLGPLVSAVQALASNTDSTPQKDEEVLAYHKYSGVWSEPVQQAISVILLQYWITNISSATSPLDSLASPQHVAQVFNVPLSNLDDMITPESALADATRFHISIPNYLHAVLILCSELSRLAFNSVTTAASSVSNTDSADNNEIFDLPVAINKFLKDVQAAFLSLNLKNDSLRRRTDGLKYDVKTVEQIVYDLTLRGLI